MRYISIWFPHLLTDAYQRRNPAWEGNPVVMTRLSHGRKIITACNPVAKQQGIYPGQTLADARAVLPGLWAEDEPEDAALRILTKLGQWCIRFTPRVGIDSPDGLFFDATGCAHLWGGESVYLNGIKEKFAQHGFQIRLAMADSYGVAWGLCRFGSLDMHHSVGMATTDFLELPIAALRLDASTLESLEMLGMPTIRQVLAMPLPALSRRFGTGLIRRIRQALGKEAEEIRLLIEPRPFEVRLPCMEPIVSRAGVDIAVRTLLDMLAKELHLQQQGMRRVLLTAYAADGKTSEVSVQTGRSTLRVEHVFSLFALQLEQVRTTAGIELFTMLAVQTEPHTPAQEKIWEGQADIDHFRLSEWIDHLNQKYGEGHVHRFIPSEHHLPEKSMMASEAQTTVIPFAWPSGPARPIHLLDPPERIEVTAPIPDYPPMLFRHQGKLHTITKADGPERIEQEWWIARGRHRDYYAVEDTEGKRYWLFRSGHYDAAKTYTWYLHGYMV